MDKFDVIIVGGGPAGSTCANFLGNENINVALFDHSHPREKPCGGGLSYKAIEKFNIPEKVADLICDRFVIGDHKGINIEVITRNKSFLVMREKFDKYLLDEARKKNILYFKERVTSVNRRNSNWIVKTKKRTALAKL